MVSEKQGKSLKNKSFEISGVQVWRPGSDALDDLSSSLRILEGRFEKADSARDRASEVDALESVDLSGRVIVPGLIDAHVHLELDPALRSPKEQLEVPRELRRRAMARRAGQMLAAGITTARDCGGGFHGEHVVRDAVSRGEVIGPRLLCCGQPLTTPDGHCAFWGGGVTTRVEIDRMVALQVEAESDWIKVMATGGVFTPGSRARDAQFDLSKMLSIVEAAEREERFVGAHCHGTEGIHRAALAGVNTIEHCSWVGRQGWAGDFQEDVAKVILNNGIWVSPTVNRGWQRMLDNPTNGVLHRVRSAYQKMLSMGIPLVASTDAGIPGVYHADLPHALRVFSEIAQLSPAQVLQTATSNAALALGIAQTTGTLAIGRDADVLLLDGNPIDDLSAVTRPVQVYCRGRGVLTD